MADTLEKEPVETTITIEEPAPAAPEAAALPTREELHAKGWTKDELDRGEKQGLVAAGKEPEPKPKPAAAAVPAPKGDKKTDPAPAPKPAAAGSAPLDYKFTPEEEAAVAQLFGKGHPMRAFYFRAKNERQARQAAEARNRDLETQLKARVAAPAPVEPALDAEGKPIDPETQPLSLKALKELQKQEAEKLETARREQGERAAVLFKAQTEQEEYVRADHPDFDDAVKKAGEVIKNFEEMFPEKWKQTKVVKMIRDLQFAAAHAEKMGLDDHHAAMIAYELGQMHPDWGQTPPPADDAPAEGDKTGSLKDPKGNGGLSADQMKRIEANTQRRGASAAVGSGGKRQVSVEDVDLAVLNQMTFKERDAFKNKHPDRYAKLVRG